MKADYTVTVVCAQCCDELPEGVRRLLANDADSVCGNNLINADFYVD
jgi:hypothetical protein